MSKGIYVKNNYALKKVKNVWVKQGGVLREKVIPKSLIGGTVRDFIAYEIEQVWETTLDIGSYSAIQLDNGLPGTFFLLPQTTGRGEDAKLYDTEGSQLSSLNNTSDGYGGIYVINDVVIHGERGYSYHEYDGLSNPMGRSLGSGSNRYRGSIQGDNNTIYSAIDLGITKHSPTSADVFGKVWSSDLGFYFDYFPGDDYVYVQDLNRNVYKLPTSGGRREFLSRLGSGFDKERGVTVSADYVYVNASDTYNRFRLYKYTKSGELFWTLSRNDTPRIRSKGALVNKEEEVYLAIENKLIKYNPSGDLISEQVFADYREITNANIDVESGTLYVLLDGKTMVKFKNA